MKSCVVNKRFPRSKSIGNTESENPIGIFTAEISQMALAYRASEIRKMLFGKSILRIKSQMVSTEAMLIREFSPWGLSFPGQHSSMGLKSISKSSSCFPSSRDPVAAISLEN